MDITCLKDAPQIKVTSNNKTVAIIPAFNEERTVGAIVAAAAQYVYEVIVVDDGSLDATMDRAISAGAYVYRHAGNLRYGKAVKTGLRVALQRGACVAVILDGDGQHDPCYIPDVLRPVLDGQADIVIASRFLQHRDCIPLIRRYGISFVNLLFASLYRLHVTDTQSGYRAFSRQAMGLNTLREKGMGFSVEILAKAIQQGLIIKEVPAPCSFHDTGHWNLSLIVQGLTVLRAVIQNWGGQSSARTTKFLNSGSDYGA